MVRLSRSIISEPDASLGIGCQIISIPALPGSPADWGFGTEQRETAAAAAARLQPEQVEPLSIGRHSSQAAFRERENRAAIRMVADRRSPPGPWPDHN